jgi:lysophospholipase L1-like esterase
MKEFPANAGTRVMWRLAIVLLALALVDYCFGFLIGQKDRFEKILEIFELHPTRLWVLKKNQRTTFQDAALTTDSRRHRVTSDARIHGAPPDGAPIICCMGDSLTFGWGVDDAEAYPSLLSREIMAQDPAVTEAPDVRNLAVPGYTTWQALRLLEEEVIPMKPRVVTVSYGVNDVSKFRFFYSDLKTDAMQGKRNPISTALRNALMQTGFVSFFRNLSLKNRERSLAGNEMIMRLSDRATQRVLPDQYRTNLEKIVQVLKENNIAVVFVKMPLNLPRGPVVSEKERARAKDLFARARSAAKDGSSDEAGVYFMRGLEADPIHRGMCWEAYEFFKRQGDEKSSRRVLDLLKKQEVYAASNLHVEYNALMDEAAERFGVPVVDVEQEFAALKGRRLFVDPVKDPYHPNAEGHRIIARFTAQAILATGALKK